MILFSCLIAIPLSLVARPSYGRSPICSNITKLEETEKWFILLDYDPVNHPVSTETLRSFNMVVLDPDDHPPLDSLKNKKKPIRIGYMSVGEAEDYRFYWDHIKDKPWVLQENPDWEGNFFVDVRQAEWRELLIQEVIPKIMEEGFQGLFLDTLDTAEFLESESPSRYDGSLEAMASLVAEIHRTYPQLMLLSNNGFAILERIAPYLSGLIVEDINMMIDFEHDGYMPVPIQERAYKIGILKPIMHNYGLNVFNIDYAPQDEPELICKNIKKSRQLGFKPYVAQKDLSEISRQCDKRKK